MRTQSSLGIPLAAALTLVAASLPAGAAGIFYYDAYGGFKEGTQSVAPFPLGTLAGSRDSRDPFNQILGDGDDAWSQFAWGTPTGDSSRTTLMGEEDRPIALDGSLEILVTFQHINEPIFEWWEPGDSSMGLGEGPAEIEVSWSLDLFATPTDAQNDENAIFHKEFQFDLSYFETHNDGTCPSPLAGFERSHVSSCDDLFFATGMKEDDGDWRPVVDGLIEFEDSFEYLDTTYTISGNGFYEFDELKGPHWTVEAGVPVGAQIRFAIVPEPDTLALVGLGLAQVWVFGRLRRKRRRA